jgi:hypothetical protein
LLQQKIAAATLPDLTQKDKDAIMGEIRSNTPEKIELDFSGPTGSNHNVRSANQAFADHSKDGDKQST